MVYFQTDLGKFFECPATKDVGKFYSHLVYFTAILYFFCCQLLYLMVILVYFSSFVMLYQEKSGNPA
jgi:hypothetical protein